MPELPEVRIMSDYINQYNKKFKKVWAVEKGNIPSQLDIIEDFNVSSFTNGKELTLKLYNENTQIQMSVFMGMSGNWKWCSPNDWEKTKHVRLKFDSDDMSLLLYGGYLGPKWKIGKFTGVKRGPDPTRDFQSFKDNILKNINNKDFNKPICEVLLNQKWFSGIGNYLRSTILYYLDVNPFLPANIVIKENPSLLELCRDIPNKAYELNGGQLKDWTNPFDTDYDSFKEWVFYQKGISCKDKTGRTFWYDSKWIEFCPY